MATLTRRRPRAEGSGTEPVATGAPSLAVPERLAHRHYVNRNKLQLRPKLAEVCVTDYNAVLSEICP